jgi:hypothetical protein
MKGSYYFGDSIVYVRIILKCTTYLQEMGCEGADWIHLTRWHVFVNPGEPLGSVRGGEFLDYLNGNCISHI